MKGEAALQDGNTTAALSIRVEPEEMRRASIWLDVVCREHAVPAKQIGRLDLCLNEALANIHMHGGETGRNAPIQLQLDVCSGGASREVTLRIVDAGPAFDPVSVEAKAHPHSLAEAKIGGLGIEMLHKFSDRISYCRNGGCNHLAIVVAWEAPASAAPTKPVEPEEPAASMTRR